MFPPVQEQALMDTIRQSGHAVSAWSSFQPRKQPKKVPDVVIMGERYTSIALMQSIKNRYPNALLLMICSPERLLVTTQFFTDAGVDIFHAITMSKESITDLLLRIEARLVTSEHSLGSHVQ